MYAYISLTHSFCYRILRNAKELYTFSSHLMCIYSSRCWKDKHFLQKVSRNVFTYHFVANLCILYSKPKKVNAISEFKLTKDYELEEWNPK